MSGLKLGFSEIDLCTRCGRPGSCAWINQAGPLGTLRVSIYLCRDCIWEALSRTYVEGRISPADVREHLEGLTQR